uniref:Uncharacterized protein n=1 Tax=Lepeophtheirus salmonis TaxID=72036 RepID=A0A0K2TLY1_LEPSM
MAIVLAPVMIPEDEDPLMEEASSPSSESSCMGLTSPPDPPVSPAEPLRRPLPRPLPPPRDDAPRPPLPLRLELGTPIGGLNGGALIVEGGPPPTPPGEIAFKLTRV